MIEFTAERYVDDVLNGEQVACRWVRLACERHRRDLETGHERGLYFDETAAKVAIAFFAVCKHSKGEWAGKPIRLEPWQQFILWALFGWKQADGLRRFRTAYLEVARKNGKTTKAAGVGLFLTAADGEPGAEVYTAATKKDQARIAHGEAVRMVKQSPGLARELRAYRDNLHSAQTFSKFEPLGADEDTTDGLNVHGVIADELHAWKNRGLWDVLETATGSRRQPLMLGITTAGSDTQSLCWQLHDYTEKILAGILEDDSFFGIVYTLDQAEKDDEGNIIRPADDWEDETVWVKANPNLGISKKVEDMQRKALRAKAMPAALNAFLQKELNVWTQASQLWIDPVVWRKGNHIPPGFDGNESNPAEVLAHIARHVRGRTAFGALDLSSNIDISCWLLLFPPDDDPAEPWWVLPRFFIPADNILARAKRDRVPYDVWERVGLLTATPGNVIDYDFILAQVDQDAQGYDIDEVGFDRWGATQISTRLQELGGDDWVVPIGQGFASMAAPMKEAEKLILAGRYGHGGHPILAWMAGNLVVVRDPSDNMKPDKARSREKIDGMVALVMATDRASRQAGTGGSMYEDEDLLVL